MRCLAADDLPRALFVAAILTFTATTASAQGQTPAQPATIEDSYPVGPDSQPQPGVPKGKLFEFTFASSKVFPGSARKVTVYVPAQYKGDKPAALYLGLDALGFEAPTVFDNLIDQRQMPVTIAVGLSPGTVASARSPEDPRFNRSAEFDSLNGDLARFVLEELLPEVERHKTPDGLPIHLSTDPNDRAAGGASTGGIGAFTLAWQRPDAFRRVFSAIGTFVGMRGGDRYPVLVRKTEPKPIRIFLQDGTQDEWMGGPEFGDWWMSNQTMERALIFAGYQVDHVFGEGAHNSRHATAIFPEAMRWLWKDWPQPVTAGASQNLFLQQILVPGTTWEAVAENHPCAGALAAGPDGAVVFQDTASGNLWRIDAEDRVSLYLKTDLRAADLAFGADGRLYAANRARRQIVSISASGKTSMLADGLDASSLLVTHGGVVYATAATRANSEGVWVLKPGAKPSLLDSATRSPTALAISPDGLWLAVAEARSHWGYSYRLQADGTTADKQRFYWFHVPDDADDSGTTQTVFDREGRLYAATRMGIQVLDRNGRSRAILPLQCGETVGIAFGGPAFDTLYVSCADHRIYRRKMQVPGAPSWATPVQLPPWSAG